MTKKHDISATEKLLDLIRKGQTTPGEETSSEPVPPTFSLDDEPVLSPKADRQDKDTSSEAAPSTFSLDDEPLPPQKTVRSTAPPHAHDSYDDSLIIIEEAPTPPPLSMELEEDDNESSFSFSPPSPVMSGAPQPLPAATKTPQPPFSFQLEMDSENAAPEQTPARPPVAITPASIPPLPVAPLPPQPQPPQPPATPKDDTLILAVAIDEPPSATVDTKLATEETKTAGPDLVEVLQQPIKDDKPEGKNSLVVSIMERFTGGSGRIIGIDIQHEYLSVVAGTRSRGTFHLLEYRQVTKDSLADKDKNTATGDDDDAFWFETSLTRILRELGGGQGQKAWCSIPIDFVEIHNLTIPNVSEKQRANAIYWATRKEAPFDEKEVLFDYSIIGDFTVKGQTKTAFTAYCAKDKTISRLKKTISQPGITLAGVTTHGIALQQLLPSRLLGGSSEPIAFLNIDIHKSYINIYSNKKILFSREVNTGLSSINEQAFNSFQHRKPGTNPGADAPAGLDSLDLFDLPAVSRLLRQMQRTFDYCMSNFEVPPVSRVLISGFPAQCAEFIRHCQSEMGVDCTAIDPIEGGKTVVTTLFPPSGTSRTPIRSSLAIALGLTVVDRMTGQNFLFTQKDKENFRLARKINIAILCFFAALLGLSGAGYSYLNKSVADLEEQLHPIRTAIERETALLGSKNPQQAMMKKITQIIAQKKANLVQAAHYSQIAMTGELCALLPADIRLIKLDFSVLPAEGKEEEPGGQNIPQELPSFRITLEAMVTAPPQTQEFLLASYLRKLGQSNLIAARADIEKTETVLVEGREVLLFKLHLKTVPAGAQKEIIPTPTEG